MKSYTLWFELYGKKMKTTVDAYTEEDAIKIIKNKIIFHKIEKQKTVTDDITDAFNNIMDMFNLKK